MSLPKYPAYKDSGVAWLGEVPEHWSMKRLKHNLKLLTEKTERRIHPVALENIESWSGRYIETDSEFEGEGVAFDSGDILFGKLRPYLAKAYMAEQSGEAVGDFHVLRPNLENISRFAQYQILNRDFISIVDSSTFGAKMPRVSWDFLANVTLATPPKNEQNIIANFLDQETSKIDALVAEQEKLIALLKEKRQAVISHAVTKGLNPSAPMKDSGIEWLGEVPAHWKVKKVKHVFYIGRGQVIAQDELLDEGLYPVFSSQTLNNGCLGYIDTFDFDCKQLTWTTDGANAGTVFLREGKHNCTNVCGTLQLKTQNFVIEFALHFLTFATQFYKRPDTNGAKIMNNEMAEIYLLFPENTEQLAIVDYLGEQTTRIDSLVFEAESAILLLKERRNALISAAVTGKIDVRGIPLNTQAPQTREMELA